MKIEKVHSHEYPNLLEVWERAVRQSHDFLSEKEINHFKPLILEHYFYAVDLRCVRDPQGLIRGFCGVADGNIEMLFIDPSSMGHGIGTALVAYAIKYQRASKVDVNEQNPKAVAFYRHVGFRVVSRSELDTQGHPFPLLHMSLNTVDELA